MDDYSGVEAIVKPFRCNRCHDRSCCITKSRVSLTFVPWAKQTVFHSTVRSFDQHRAPMVCGLLATVANACTSIPGTVFVCSSCTVSWYFVAPAVVALARDRRDNRTLHTLEPFFRFDYPSLGVSVL